MMPPICAVCDLDFRDQDGEYEGGVVEFDHDEEDEEMDEVLEENDSEIPHHPDYVLWFCADHIEEAEKLSYLNSNQAVSRLKSMYNF